MCKCLSETMVCCCFKCAVSVLISIIFSSLVILAIIGGVVYYFYYYKEEHKDVASDIQKDLNKGYDNAVSDIKDVLKGIRGS